MSTLALQALAALRLQWAPVPSDVWQPAPFHVDGLHRSAERTVSDGIDDAAASTASSPIGVALVGQAGVGKTHFLGWTRQQVQARDGYFFLVEVLEPARFWESVVISVVEGLGVRAADGGTQLQALLARLLRRTGLAPGRHGAILGHEPLTPQDLDDFVAALRAVDDGLVVPSLDTLRALVLHGSADPDGQDVAATYLAAGEEQEPGERAPWRIRREPRRAQELIRDISRLLALTGPTVIAVDQLDAMLAPTAAPDALDQMAAGLMQLRDLTRRTVTVIACLPETWEQIHDRAIGTVRDRFREAGPLRTIPSATAGRTIVARRFEPRFGKVGFTPPYDTWPIRPEAFVDAPTYTPRRLLMAIDSHVRRCLDAGTVVELTSLVDVVEPAGNGRSGTAVVPSSLDRAFEEAMAAARSVVDAAVDPVSEDDAMPPLLTAGLRAWTVERDVVKRYEWDVPTKGKPLLHARLRRLRRTNQDPEMHWAFRMISAEHWKAVGSRVEKARLRAGHDGSPTRKLFLLREKDDWPTQPSVQRAIEEFERAGGRRLQVARQDLEVFAALQVLFEAQHDGLEVWLRQRAPASATQLLREALGDAEGRPGPSARPAPDGGPVTAPAHAPDETGTGSSAGPAPPTWPHATGSPTATGGPTAPDRPPPVITLGVAAQPLRIELATLRKHTAIFAGSGSGKTVLIRRIVEECALQGVSAIVLDPNNDLARLGDRWPVPPQGWGPDDPEKAARYLSETDVVVWTPRRTSGRPLSFQPLPDFTGVVGDVDEFDQAVDVAVSALTPQLKVDGHTTRAVHSRAVLTEALRSFARRGGSGLDDFVAFLAELPDGTSRMTRAGTLAAEMSETLTAAMVNDPLLGGGGTPLDPGVLLTPPAGKHARISVISFVGLQAETQRQSFVNQLQMALFAWIKRHPAGDRPLGGLLVMDEAQTLAPSGAMTASTASTLALASQARKYGLGLVFATQAPKGLHNRIPGNASTQFFGRLNSPAQIAAGREMARAKGGDAADIAQLRTGQFYVALEGAPFVKAQTPLCLSHHPSSPLTSEEVVRRAGADATWARAVRSS